MTDFNVKVGKNIRELREKREYSREKLAGRIEISVKYLYEIEKGKKGISAHKLFLLANSLGVTTDYLISGKPESKKHTEAVHSLHDLTAKELHHLEDITRRIVAFSKSCSVEQNSFETE